MSNITVTEVNSLSEPGYEEELKLAENLLSLQKQERRPHFQ